MNARATEEGTSEINVFVERSSPRGEFPLRLINISLRFFLCEDNVNKSTARQRKKRRSRSSFHASPVRLHKWSPLFPCPIIFSFHPLPCLFDASPLFDLFRALHASPFTALILSWASDSIFFAAIHRLARGKRGQRRIGVFNESKETRLISSILFARVYGSVRTAIRLRMKRLWIG